MDEPAGVDGGDGAWAGVWEQSAICAAAIMSIPPHKQSIDRTGPTSLGGSVGTVLHILGGGALVVLGIKIFGIFFLCGLFCVDFLCGLFCVDFLCGLFCVYFLCGRFRVDSFVQALQIFTAFMRSQIPIQTSFVQLLAFTGIFTKKIISCEIL